MTDALIGLFQLAKDSFSSWSKRRHDASCSAIRLVCILDEYAAGCISVVVDKGKLQDYRHHYSYRIPQVTPPEPPGFPQDIAPSIKKSLVYRIRALPDTARNIKRYLVDIEKQIIINDFLDTEDIEAVLRVRQKCYVQIGLEALEIADDLRKQFGIPARSKTEADPDEGPKAFLQKKLDELTRGAS